MNAGNPGKALLGVQNVVKSFGAQPVLREVSLTIHEGDRIGLVGVNGAGKSTLMRIMARLESPDEGVVTRAQGLRVGLLDQQSRLAHDRTVGEVLDASVADLRALVAEYHAVGAQLAEDQPTQERRRVEARYAQLAHELAITDAWNLSQAIKKVAVALELPATDRRVGTLSGGELRRVDLATRLIARPDVLLLDEPTNQIDTRSIEWIEHFLEAYRGSCVLVTHDRYFLDRIVNRIVEIDGNRLFIFPGRYERFLEYKTDLQDTEARAHARGKGILRRELEWLRRGPKARGTKQKARLQRIDQMMTGEGPPPASTKTFAIPEPKRLGKLILEVEGVARAYGENLLFRDVSLVMQKDVRLGVVGPNGCGKTTLLQVCMGIEAPDEGRVVIGDATAFLYVDQGRADMDPDMTVLKFVSNGLRHWDVGDQRLYVPAYLERFLFDHGSVDMPMRNLSGGERNRVDLARKLLRGGNFLVLDEPTNDLDLATLRVLEEAILAFNGCALIVSHDRYFLNRVCTHLLVFEGAGQVVQIAGNYDDYLLYCERRDALAAKSAPKTKSTKRRSRRDAPRGLTWGEQQELEGIEDAIVAAEAEVARLESAVNAPGFFERNYAEVQKVLAERQEAQTAVDALYARWEYLEKRNAEAT